MGEDPFVREKFTRGSARRQKAGRGIFPALPKRSIPNRSRKLAPSAIAEYRVHHEAAAGAVRGRRPVTTERGWKRRVDDPRCLPTLRANCGDIYLSHAVLLPVGAQCQ